MRKILMLSLVCVLLSVVSGFGQDSYCDLLKSDLTADRADIIKKTIPLTEEQAEFFWPLYQEYEEALLANQARRDMLTAQLAENYDSLDAKLASGLAEALFDVGDQRSQLQRRFYKKLSRELPAALVIKYFQLEFQLNMLSDLQVAAQLPQLVEHKSDTRSSGQE